MAAAIPPNNTTLLVVLGVAAAWLLMRNGQARSISSNYGTPYASPVNGSYLQSPSVGGQLWFGQNSAQQAQQQAIIKGQQKAALVTQLGNLTGTVINRFWSPQTDAPYTAPAPDYSASGSSPNMSGNWGIPDDLFNWEG